MRDCESREDYLETMLLLKNEKGYIRSIDIADKMNFSKPSVSRAVGLLKDSGHITTDAKTGVITFTNTGLCLAEEIYERHTLLTNLLLKIGVPADIAAADACRIEHFLSDETLSCIKKLSENDT